MVRSLGHIEGRVWMCLWRALGRAARRTAAHKVMVLYSPGSPRRPLSGGWWAVFAGGVAVFLLLISINLMFLFTITLFFFFFF